MSQHWLSVITTNDRPTPVMYCDGHYYALAGLVPALSGFTDSGLLPLLSEWTTAKAIHDELGELVTPIAQPQT